MDLGGQLGERWGAEWSASAVRRGNAARKLTIYAESHLAMVHAAIAARCKEPATAAYVKRFASRAPNLTKAVADTVAVCYSRGCGRELVGVDEATAKAFAEIVAESGIGRKASALNARAWLAPVLVSPHLDRRNLLALDFIGADRFHARLDGDYIEGALWRQGGHFIEITDDAWHVFNAEGALVESALHACGAAPGVFTVAIDNSADAWLDTAHEGLADATLDVAYLVAWNRYVRQVSGVAMVVITASEDVLKAASGQAIGHPGQPFVIPGTPSEVNASLLNRMVPAAEGLAEISAAINMAISAEGIPAGAVSLGNIGAGGLIVEVDDDRLALLRDKQVPWMHAAELRLWPLVCDLIRGSQHRHARILPPGDEVREALRLNYPDLASPKARLERIAALKAGLPFGLSSPTDEKMAMQPELTRAEASEKRRQYLGEYIDDIRPLTERNIPAEAPEAHGVQTTAQEQGREGGEASGRTRSAQAQETDP